jgi:hypothetical protein
MNTYSLKLFLIAALMMIVIFSAGACMTKRAPTPGNMAALPSPSQSRSAPPISDEAAGKILGLDGKAIAAIRKETGEPFYRLDGYSEDGSRVASSAVIAGVPGGKVEDAVRHLRTALSPGGCHVYLADVYGDNAQKIILVKGKDHFAIVEMMCTSAPNYEHSHADIMAKLREWEKRHSFVVIGAAPDWVHLEFTKLPSDLAGFSKEVYDFCPDSVDQGTGSLEALEDEIRKTSRLFLWWD